MRRYLAVLAFFVAVLLAGCDFGISYLVGKIDRREADRQWANTFPHLQSVYSARIATDPELSSVFASASVFQPGHGGASPYAGTGELLVKPTWFSMPREQRTTCVRKAAEHLVSAMDDVGVNFFMNLTILDDKRAPLAEIGADRQGINRMNGP